jgi:hypothetical protein
MKFYRKTFWLAFLLYLVTLSSCRASSFWQTATPMPLSGWITHWISNPICAPPCWEKITPGETNLDEGVALLEKIQGVKIKSWPSQNRDVSQQVNWDFGSSGESGSITAHNNGQIDTIYLKISSQQSLSLKQIFESYGSPSEIFFYSCMDEMFNKFCEVHLIYDEIGLVLVLGLSDNGKEHHQVSLSEKSNIFAIWLIRPKTNSYGELIGKNSFFIQKNFINGRVMENTHNEEKELILTDHGPFEGTRGFTIGYSFGGQLSVGSSNTVYRTPQ